MNLNLKLRGKLILFTGLLIAVLVAGQSTLSYLALTASNNRTIQTTEQNFDDILRTSTQNLIGSLNAVQARLKAGELTEAQALSLSKSLVRDTRYGDDNAGYFWADKSDGECAVHPNPEYEGTMRYDDVDKAGNKYIQMFIAAGNKGGGFTDFYFTQLNKDGIYQKRAYTLLFEPYGWYISTGNYHEDTDIVISGIQAEGQRSHLLLLTTSSLIGIVGLVCCIFLARRITHPLQQMTERLKGIAASDFHTPVPDIRSSDETGELARAAQQMVIGLQQNISDLSECLSEMAEGNITFRLQSRFEGDMKPIQDSMETISDSLNQDFTQIRSAAEELDGNAQQIATDAQVLAQNSAEQCSTAENLTELITNISQDVSSTASRAQHEKEQMNGAVEHVLVNTAQMRSLLAAMENIQAAFEKMSRMNKDINDIAFQTNILALNAAVEAARAGEHGRGFSVVSDEVNLAQKSAETASQTEILIGETKQAVGRGVEAAETTAQSLSSMEQILKEMQIAIAQIDQATEHQAEAVQNFHVGMAQMSESFTHNSAAAQQSAAVSEELKEQANSLYHIVSKFILSGSRPDSSLPTSAEQPSYSSSV